MKVSVIITSYNYENYIKDAIESVLAQTCQDFELIIIDDASADSSWEIIERYARKDKRIKTIKNVVNRGLAKSLKTAISAASGEFVAILESDDTWNKNYLEKKLEIFEQNPDAGLVYNAVKFIGYYSKNSEKKFNSIMQFSEKWEYPKNMFYDFGDLNKILTLSSVMVRRHLLESLDYKSPIDKLTDWYLYIQLAKNTDFYYLSLPLTVWRLHKDSYIYSKKNKKFRLVSISAYLKFLRQEPLNLKLLIFIMFSFIMLCYRKFKHNN